ncbi:MAG TPA: hypothetical protein VJ875_04115 [Pyrinomonadaceae bacterium]|nr:hypothetical protein [Pyrinomonadaceae bacterium]
MRRLFTQMFQRPINAIASSLALIGQTSSSRQLIDGMVSRFVYALVKIEREEDGKTRNKVNIQTRNEL